MTLTTINASYRNRLDANAFAQALLNPDTLRTVAGPMSSFFYELSPDRQIAFAKSHGVPLDKLKEAMILFDAWSGRDNLALARL